MCVNVNANMSVKFMVYIFFIIGKFGSITTSLNYLNYEFKLK